MKYAMKTLVSMLIFYKRVIVVSVLDTNSLQSILAQMQGNLALGGDSKEFKKN